MLEPQYGELQRGKPNGETTNKSETPYLPKKEIQNKQKLPNKAAPKSIKPPVLSPSQNP